MSDTEYSIIWFYAVYSCCPFVLLNSVLCYDFILDMVYYGIIFINRKTARKRHNSWGFAVTSFWGRAKWPNGLARRRNAQRSQEAVCFDVYPWMRRAMVGAISCCFRVEGGHVHVGNCCSIFLRRKFQQRYPKTVHFFFGTLRIHIAPYRGAVSQRVFASQMSRILESLGGFFKRERWTYYMYIQYISISI